MTHRWTKFALSGVALAILIAGVVVYSRTDRDRAPTAAGVVPIPVIATTVQTSDVPIVLTGLGTVTALNTATLHSQITGLLISVDFEEGQAVKKGDVLAKIDPRTFQAQLDQAEATLSHDQTQLRNAQLNLQRYATLVTRDAVARQQFDDQQAAVDELGAQIKGDQAAVDNAKAQLSYTSLIAPFDGVTGIRLLDVGNIIHPPSSSAALQPGAPDPNALVVVAQVQPISVIFNLASASIPEIQRAMASGPLESMAYSQDGKTKLDTGKLAAVNNQADPATGTVQLKAIFPNQQRQLWPGTFVNVWLVLSTEQKGLTIPLDALQQGPQGPIVYVVDNDHRATIRPISMRQSLSGKALIEKGLSAGETVVVRGQYRLSPGTLVTLADPNDPGAVPNPSTASSGMLP
jgi:membrane fusion protein, multidrug efflux system